MTFYRLMKACPIPDMKSFSAGVVKIFPVFLVLFLALIPPAYYGYRRTNGEVYYDMADCLPEDIRSSTE